MHIVTSYIKPDLDGTASMVAYSEFLRKTGKQSKYYIEGIPMQEVKIVCDLFDIDLNPIKEISPKDKIILVDTNYLVFVPFVNPENVVEVIDHHAKVESADECKNATFQIELIGAAATLIAEKFYQNQVPISRESAILLYYGIISNTINLKAKITSKKDFQMAKWLKEQCSEISEEKIIGIFTKKSVLRKPLREEMEVQVQCEVDDKKLVCGQIEYVNMEEFLAEKEEEIRSILQIVKQEKNLDYILINCIDILKGKSTILVIDQETEDFLSNRFHITFENQKAKLDELILRKEITKKLEIKI